MEDIQRFVEARAFVKLNRHDGPETDNIYMNEMARRINEACDIIETLIPSHSPTLGGDEQ